MTETVLALILFLSPIYGGTIRANELVFETPALCERLKKELAGFSVKHEIVRDCAPRIAPAPPGEPESIPSEKTTP